MTRKSFSMPIMINTLRSRVINSILTSENEGDYSLFLLVPAGEMTYYGLWPIWIGGKDVLEK